jgi:hypothetical protein
MKINISKEDIKNFNVDYLRDTSLNTRDWRIPGQSPYQLYAYLSTFFDSTIIVDIGTGLGGSALALSHNPKNRILSYDVFYQSADRIIKDNIEWRIDNILEDNSFDWDAVSIVCLDTDSEDGSAEKSIIESLRGKNWTGILLIDKMYKRCIHKVWKEIFFEKLDVTDIGSKKGTGIVNFGPRKKHEISIV